MPRPSWVRRYSAALLWPKIGTDRYGQPRVGPPVEVRVRWDWGRREVLSSDGTSQAADARVILDRAVEVGSLMWLGRLRDLPGTSLVPEEGLMQVISYRGVQDVKARGVAHSADLMRYHDKQRVG